MDAWREQYDRMLWWHGKIKEPQLAGEDRDTYNERLRNYLLAFFETCLHLRDWLRNDPTNPLSDQALATFLNNSSPLKLCHDIAVGSKHLRIDRPKIDAHTRILVSTLSRSLPLSGPHGPLGALTFQGTYAEVSTGSTDHDALTLADHCLREWNAFLASEGLLPRSS